MHDTWLDDTNHLDIVTSDQIVSSLYMRAGF